MGALMVCISSMPPVQVYAQTSRAVRASLREYQERMASAGLPAYGQGDGSEVPPQSGVLGVSQVWALLTVLGV